MESFAARPSTRSSMLSLYDLLTDLDDTSLQDIIHQMNNTTSQNMAVGQAISAIETENPSYHLSRARTKMDAPTMSRTLSKSQKIRLSLQTIFQPAPSSRRDFSSLSSISSMSSRTSPAYKRISRPFPLYLPPETTVADLQAMLYTELFETQSAGASSPTSSSAAGSPGSGRIRRYPSTIDMALEAERSAGGFEGLGLGMLEPRPVTPVPSIRGGSVDSSFSVFVPSAPVVCGVGPARAPSPVMDGIFEVMESR